MSEPVRYSYEIGGILDAIVVDTTSTEALLVRKDSDGGNVFIVDTINDTVKVFSTTESTSTATGALQVAGGVGCKQHQLKN